MELISYAQNFEDIRLWRAFRDIDCGRYLDIGTQDPVLDSVSRLFYERGWRGVHVEPTPHYADAMRSARPDEQVIEAAVSSSATPLQFFEFPDTGLSTGISTIAAFHEKAGWVSRQILVPTISLAGLFDHMGPDPIHWLKIDVEGMEADVLKSWGDHPARPLALVVEATQPSTQEPSHEAWHRMVTQRGYREVQFDGLSRYFIHESEAHRGEALALSPNVFDGFQVLRAHFSAARIGAEADQAVADLRSEVEALADHFAEASAAASEASAKLDAALKRTGELEEVIASDTLAHAQALDHAHAAAAAAQAELDAARQALRDLESRRTAEAGENAQALALANAAALAASTQLADALERVAERDGKLISEAAAHSEATARAHAEAAEAAASLDAALQRLADLENRYAQEAESHARHLAEAQAAATQASAQLEGMAQRISELENRIASEALKLAQLQSEAAYAEVNLDEARRNLTALQHELAVESAAHRTTRAQASASAAELLGKLDLADTKVQELQLRLEERTRLHEAALDLAKERSALAQRALAETTAQLHAAWAEHQVLGRETGRLEGQLEAQEQRYAAEIAGAAVRQQGMRDRLDKAEQELAAVRDLAADLRAQLIAQIARSEDAAAAATTEKEAAKALLDAAREESRNLKEKVSDLTGSLDATSLERDEFAARADELALQRAKLIGSLHSTERMAVEAREQANRLSEQAAVLADRLTSIRGERDAFAEQLELVSRERGNIAEALEVARQQAADASFALHQEIESLRLAVALRERRIEQAETLLASAPDPMAELYGLRRTLFRKLIGDQGLSAFASHTAATKAWQQEALQAPLACGADKVECSLDCEENVPQWCAATSGAAMLVDDGSVTSVAQLLALHDRSFIHASYQSLLGRLPDAEGEAYYLARLRAGVHKLAILRQIRSSAEGSTFVPVLDGLDRTLSRYRWAMLPLVGYLFRLVWRVDGNGHTPQALRAITNNIARISSELARRQAEQAALATAVQELAARPLGMPTVPVAQPEPFIDEPRGEDSAAELTIPGVEHLGRDASRILGLMAKSMHKQKHCRVAVDASRN